MVNKYGFCFVLLGLLLISCGSQKQEPATSSSSPAAIDQRTPAPTSGGNEAAPSSRQQAGLRNQPPEIKNARFEVDGDTVHAIAEAEDPDGDKVKLQYTWIVNNQKIDASIDSVSGLNTGDRVQATITPSDGKQNGQPRGLFAIISNQAPKITPGQPKFDDPNWSMKVDAKDPDGDPIEFHLEKAPPGMKIDPVNGVITWNTEGVNDGKYSATVSVTDGHGGATEYTFDVTLGQQE